VFVVAALKVTRSEPVTTAAPQKYDFFFSELGKLQLLSFTLEINGQLQFLKYVKKTSPALEAQVRLRIAIQAVECVGADHENVLRTIEQRRGLKVTYDGGCRLGGAMATVLNHSPFASILNCFLIHNDESRLSKMPSVRTGR
jgi:hypothetical protein